MVVASSGIEPESGAPETLILSIVLRGRKEYLLKLKLAHYALHLPFLLLEKNLFLLHCQQQ